MGGTLRRIARLCQFIGEPVPSVWQWVGLLQGLAIVGILAAGAISFLTESPFVFLVSALSLLLALTSWASYRLYAKVERLEAPPTRPHNWEAIIREAREVLRVGDEVIRNHHLWSMVRNERPDFPLDRAQWDAFHAAKHRLDTEIAIAGTAFDRFMQANYMYAVFQPEFFRWEDEGVEDEKYNICAEALKSGMESLISRLAK